MIFVGICYADPSSIELELHRVPIKVFHIFFIFLYFLQTLTDFYKKNWCAVGYTETICNTL